MTSVLTKRSAHGFGYSPVPAGDQRRRCRWITAAAFSDRAARTQFYTILKLTDFSGNNDVTRFVTMSCAVLVSTQQWGPTIRSPGARDWKTAAGIGFTRSGTYVRGEIGQFEYNTWRFAAPNRIWRGCPSPAQRISYRHVCSGGCRRGLRRRRTCGSRQE